MRDRLQSRVLSGLALIGACLFAPLAVRAGVVGSPHDFSLTGPFTQSMGIAPAGACSGCHLPHKGDIYSLWPRTLEPYRSNLVSDGSLSSIPNYVAPATIQCYDCHDYHSGSSPTALPNNVPADTLFNASHRPQNIAAGFTRNNPPGVYNSANMTESPWGGTVAGFYENDPPFASSFGADPNLQPLAPPYPVDNSALLRTGGHYFKRSDPTGSVGDRPNIGDKLPCRDCHDPHVWSGSWQAFIKRGLGGTAGSDRIRPSGSPTASRYMANEFTSGARNDAYSRTLCIACHGDSNTQAPVAFSSIGYSSSALIVRPPNTIAEHRDGNAVACVACHAHNSVDASCTDCHGYPPPPYPAGKDPESGTLYAWPGGGRGLEQTHARHFGFFNKSTTRFSVYGYDCDLCHANGDLHQNNNVEIIFDFFPHLVRDNWRDNPPSKQAWTGSNYTRTTCADVYCHSLGFSDNSVNPTVPPSTTVPYFRSVTWGTAPLGCNGCHATTTVAGTLQYGMPEHLSQGAGMAAANSHDAHVLRNGYECTVCHYATVSGTYSARVIRGAGSSPPVANAYHVNGISDVVFDGTTAVGASDGEGGYHHDNNVLYNKRCNVNCHGTGKPILERPQWGGSAGGGGCFSCHNGVEQVYKPQLDYGLPGNPNPVDNNEYLTSGHGRYSGVYPGDNNAPAYFSNYSTAPVDCYYCHSANAAHGTKNPNDPYRLGYGSDATGQKGYVKGAFADNTDDLCLRCHGAPDPLNPQRATGALTQNMQTHAQGITGTKYAWSNTPWKCVDCHDPHGDGKPGAERWMMLRSGINAPTSVGDGANAGSDAKSTTKRTTNISAITFTSQAGFAAGSYAQPGNGAGGVWGPCEVCHNQPNTYSRTADNANTHATRTGRCATCHPHSAGFAPKACKGCHGGDTGDPGQVSNNAPNVTAWWTTSGHGQAFSTRSALGPVQCEECHDVGYLSGANHRTDGSAGSGPAPANVNTLTWPGKPVNANTQPTANTPHLRSSYFPASATHKYDYARAFNRKCGDPATGCHPLPPHNNHPQVPTGSVNPADNVMRFGDGNSVLNPKSYYWYPVYPDYRTGFYESRSPWEIEDVTTNATGVGTDSGTRYGVCVSCHDPHGTNSTRNIAGGTTNRMLRGVHPGNQFCNIACHTTRTPP